MILTISNLVTPTSPLGFQPICTPPIPSTPTSSPSVPPVLIV